MLATHLGPYGSTQLSSHEIKLLAREALRSGERAPSIVVNVFYMDAPHSGGTGEGLDVIFEKFEEDEDLLIGSTPSGHAVVFMLGNTTRTATFITQKPRR